MIMPASSTSILLQIIYERVYEKKHEADSTFRYRAKQFRNVSQYIHAPSHIYTYILSARKHTQHTHTLTNTALTTTAHCRQRSHQSRDHIEENSCSCNCKQLPCLLSDRIAAEVNCVENYNIYKSQIVIILSFLINA